MIEYYLRELEDEGVTAIPQWTPPVVSGTIRLRLPPRSIARPIPESSAQTGPDSTDADADADAEIVPGSPDGQCFISSHNQL